MILDVIDTPGGGRPTRPPTRAGLHKRPTPDHGQAEEPDEDHEARGGYGITGGAAAAAAVVAAVAMRGDQVPGTMCMGPDTRD